MKLAIICDLREEHWPSMDLVAEMLLQKLAAQHTTEVQAVHLCPPLKRRFTRLPLAGKRAIARNADRLANRFWDYPRFLRRQNERFALYHIVDHSYAQLVHELPPERTIVTCHDLDTFRCLLEPEREPRSTFFRAMTRRILSGLQRAAKVVCVSVATRDQLLAHQLIPARRLAIARLGVHPSCRLEAVPQADAEAAKLLGAPQADVPEVMHVGSTIPRKRLDVLLHVFAAVRATWPRARLVRVGGDFTPPQRALAAQLGLHGAVQVLPFLDRDVLAAVYRRAALVLQPSEAEGFGLPVAEAMACGTPVVASDLGALREIGGEVALYRPVGELAAWSELVVDLLREREREPERWALRRRAAVAQAAKFSWTEYARQMVAIYRELAV